MRVKSECKNKDKKKSTQSARSARSAVCSLHGLRFGVTATTVGLKSYKSISIALNVEQS